MSKVIAWLGLSIFILILDQFSKYWIRTRLELHEQVPLLDGFNLTFACNTGAAFSFLSDAGGWQRWFFIVLAIAVSLFILVWLIQVAAEKIWLSLALSMVLAGAVGNVLDRILVGCVVDFIQVYLAFMPSEPEWLWNLFNPWPSFNIADSAIFVGALMLIIDSFKQTESDENQ